MPDWRQLVAAAGVVLVLVAYVPYIGAILAGRVRPHAVSWAVWSGVTTTVFFAQLAGGAGAGAWPMGMTGAIVLLVAGLAWLRRGDLVITRFDWLCLIAAAAALPAWALTDNPFWAVVILVGVDLLGFAPTFRRAHDHPHGDSMLFYSLLAGRNVIALTALDVWSPTTALFPISSTIACLGFALFLAVRRAALRGAPTTGA